MSAQSDKAYVEFVNKELANVAHTAHATKAAWEAGRLYEQKARIDQLLADTTAA